ncbi:hypothetical protein PENSPDRAFT_217693 [Peniophora sp. CONT]|nr:hypothetical protein PENSPDRAFT_217693 [Peniophora sp. CONT]
MNAKYKAQLQQQDSRRSLRRQSKSDRRLSAVPEWKKRNNGRDPTPLISSEFMSDEASCDEGYTPEDKEQQVEWNERMNEIIYKDLSAEELKGAVLAFELIDPLWRSKRVRKIFAELDAIHLENLDEKARKKFNRRVKTDRTSNRLPNDTPYDYAISQKWYNDNKDSGNMSAALEDWYCYVNPEGWDGDIEDSSDSEAGED